MNWAQLIPLLASIADFVVGEIRAHAPTERDKQAVLLAQCAALVASEASKAASDATMNADSFETEVRGMVAVAFAEAGYNADAPPTTLRLARDVLVWGAVAEYRKLRS